MRVEQRGVLMRWMECAAVAACALADNAGAQSLFDAGPVGFTELQASPPRQHGAAFPTLGDEFCLWF